MGTATLRMPATQLNAELVEFEKDVSSLRAQLTEKVRLRELKSQEYVAERRAALDAELPPAIAKLETALSNFAAWRTEIVEAAVRLKALAAQHSELRRAIDVAQTEISQVGAAHFDAFASSAALGQHLTEALAGVAKSGGTVLKLDAQTKQFLHIGGAGQEVGEGIARDVTAAALYAAAGAASRGQRRDWR